MAEDKKVVTKKTAKKKAAAAGKSPAAPAPVTKEPVTKKTVAKKAATKKAPAAPTEPVTKKTVAKKAVAKKVPVAKAAPQPPLPDRAVTLKPVSEVTPEERYRMIQEAAYYRAEKRGFAPGHDAEDWAAAVAEIDALIGRGD